MGLFKDFATALVIIPFVFLAITLLGIFDADVFSAIFSPMGLIIALIVTFCEVAMARI